MEDDKSRLIKLFERKIQLLLEENDGYARFKCCTPAQGIQNILANNTVSREDMVALGFLIHLNALKLRLTMYEAFTPFDLMNFRNDVQEIINTLHQHKRLMNVEEQNILKSMEETEGKILIPPLLYAQPPRFVPANDPELYDAILSLFRENDEEVPINIPEDIIKQMQAIDRKRIFSELPQFIQGKKEHTVRELSKEFSVFENDRLSLAAVFSEVLFLANEGKIRTWQMTNDIGVKSV
jgi:hypothetical protein